tara:strand:- start:104109 stop:107174 length:3066 start_codon:yes stop_codon:yes gene_type:complete
MNKALIYILILCFAFSVKAQSVQLATQKGHSAAIELIEFSENGEFLVSLGENNEGIVWDLNLKKILTRFKLAEQTEISGIKFIENDKTVKIQGEENTFYFDIKTDQLESTNKDNDTLFHRSDYYSDPNGIHTTFIEKGGIKKEEEGRWFANYWVSVTYTHAIFYAFDVSRSQNLIVGVAGNNAIYCHEYESGKEIEILQGHNSSATAVRFSHDGSLFATAGKDRSIVIWDAATLTMKFRLFSNIFRKNTAIFSHDGNQIHVGDEIGNLFTIDLNAIFPSTSVRSEPQSINEIRKHNYDGEEAYFISTSNNVLEIKNEIDQEPQKLIKYREHELTRPKGLLLQEIFGLYQEPIGEVQSCSFSPNNDQILLTGETDLPNITLARLNKNETKHLYAYKDDRNWIDAAFLNAEEFVSVLDSSGTLSFWRLEKDEYFFKKDSLPFIIEGFKVIDEQNIWLNAGTKGQFIYDRSDKRFKKALDIEAKNIFKLQNKIMLSDVKHQLLIIDPDSLKVEATFSGHTERITGVDIHPEKNFLITSSDDGTIKLWDRSATQLIASVIPFENNEVVIITAENYYLISKGALDEIGFKYNDQFFYPDQFDLKYNRPDLVLEKLGYTNDDLIKAYHRAYKKRLKKLNFTEEALSGDFHLPEIEIIERSSIPIETDEKQLMLKVKMKDDKDKLERYKVWINDVAVLGSSGKSIRDEERSELTTTIPLNLSYGDNKIEVSVLNQSGAESYKESVNVKCTAGKQKPDAYIISIGVSKYQNEQFNLAYATKDAIDIENLFINSDYFGTVHTKSLTDQQVVLESLDDIQVFLDQAEVDDFVMVFIAGHGVLDENFDYYFASYDMDFKDPSERGIPYKKIEELVDGIKALKKLLILDTCHSGELDKDEIEEDENPDDEPIDGKFRNAGIDVTYREDPLGFESINYLMKQVFLDLRRGTGATVISSSGGTELAFESPKYKNGLFTYSLIDGLKNEKADTNKDEIITVSELQGYLIQEVKNLSNGKQVPTSRIHNKEMDYRVW